MFKVDIHHMAHAKDLPLPEQMSVGSSGFDLYAAMEEKKIRLQSGKWKLIPTGISIAMPLGLEAQVRPRSGLALKKGITVLNTPGTIDADYRGEIGVILLHLGEQDVVIQRGDRIAQLVFQQIPQVHFKLVDELNQTKRGTGGFGHTGK